MSIAQMRAYASAQPKEMKRFVKFATVGALGSVTDFTLLNGLIQLFGFPLSLANACSFTAAVLQNFTLNRLWTFPESRERKLYRQLVQFALVNMVGLGINQLVFLNLHAYLQPYWQQIVPLDWSFEVSYNFAKLFAIGVVLFWNFLVNRLWTYRGL